MSMASRRRFAAKAGVVGSLRQRLEVELDDSRADASGDGMACNFHGMELDVGIIQAFNGL